MLAGGCQRTGQPHEPEQYAAYDAQLVDPAKALAEELRRAGVVTSLASQRCQTLQRVGDTLFVTKLTSQRKTLLEQGSRSFVVTLVPSDVAQIIQRKGRTDLVTYGASERKAPLQELTRQRVVMLVIYRRSRQTVQRLCGAVSIAAFVRQGQSLAEARRACGTLARRLQQCAEPDERFGAHAGSHSAAQTQQVLQPMTRFGKGPTPVPEPTKRAGESET